MYLTALGGTFRYRKPPPGLACLLAGIPATGVAPPTLAHNIPPTVYEKFFHSWRVPAFWSVPRYMYLSGARSQNLSRLLVVCPIPGTV
jgi:hypothetical protein